MNLLGERILEILDAGPVMPVVTLDRLEDALPLADALMAGGIKVIEMTLRTDAGWRAIERLSSQRPDMIVGAGTVLSTDGLKRVASCGARFAVSPGLTAPMCQAAQDLNLPYLPGTSSATDLMNALSLGYEVVKFFPAQQAGGIAMLRALGAPFPGFVFCPTGGIGPSDARAYLALPNVRCVGGSWVAPSALIGEGDWDGITRLARQAVSLGAPARPD